MNMNITWADPPQRHAYHEKEKLEWQGEQALKQGIHDQHGSDLKDWTHRANGMTQSPKDEMEQRWYMILFPQAQPDPSYENNDAAWAGDWLLYV